MKDRDANQSWASYENVVRICKTKVASMGHTAYLEVAHRFCLPEQQEGYKDTGKLFFYSEENITLFHRSPEVRVPHCKCLTKAALMQEIVAYHALDHRQFEALAIEP